MQSLDQLSSKFPFRFYQDIIIAQKEREENKGEERGGKKKRGEEGKEGEGGKERRTLGEGKRGEEGRGGESYAKVREILYSLHELNFLYLYFIFFRVIREFN